MLHGFSVTTLAVLSPAGISGAAAGGVDSTGDGSGTSNSSSSRAATGQAGSQTEASSPGHAADAPPGVVPILCWGARTDRLSELATGEEFERMQRELRQAPHGDCFELVADPDGTVGSLIAGLVQVQPHVLHISAHAGVPGAAPDAAMGARDVELPNGRRAGIYAPDDPDTPRLVSGHSLARMIKASAPGVRVAVLVCCHSDEMVADLLGVVDIVIAMADSIGDKAALSFSPAFVRGLAHDWSVGRAFDQAVGTLAGLPDERQPKLWPRKGIDPHELHLIREPRTQEALPRPEFDTGEAMSLLRVPTLRVSLVTAALALALFTVGAVAAALWSHEAGRQTVPPSPPAPVHSRAEAVRPAPGPATPEALASDAREMPDRTPSEAPGQRPGSQQRRIVAPDALPVRAPDPPANAGPPRQPLTAPAVDIALRATAILTAAGRKDPADEVTRGQVHRGVRDAVELLRGCYEDQLLYTPTLWGDVRARFSIGVDGRVDDSTATGLGDAVNSCVAAVIRSLVFPRGDSRVLVTYPFHFRLVPRPRGHRGVSPALEVGAPAVGRLRGQPGGT